ncbi:hypothetical protein IAT40_004766 [Kwoniella sp. CBS 6097]
MVTNPCRSPCSITTITQVLHPHIMNHILSFMSTPTLASMARVSKDLATLALPFLWEDITLDLNNATSNHPLLSPSPSPSSSLLRQLENVFGEETHQEVRAVKSESVNNDQKEDPHIDDTSMRADRSDPRNYVKRLTIIAHYDGQSHGRTSTRTTSTCTHTQQPLQNIQMENQPPLSSIATTSSTSAPIEALGGRLPNLHTLHLTIHAKSPVGWSFCRPSDRVRYPVYPASSPCPLLESLRPKRLIISGISTLDSLNPFPLPVDRSPIVRDGGPSIRSSIQGNFWNRITEVVLVVGVYDFTRTNSDGGGYLNGRDNFLRNVPKTVRDLKIVLPESPFPGVFPFPSKAPNSNSDMSPVSGLSLGRGQHGLRSSSSEIESRQIIEIHVIADKISKALETVHEDCMITIVGMEAFIDRDYVEPNHIRQELAQAQADPDRSRSQSQSQEEQARPLMTRHSPRLADVERLVKDTKLSRSSHDVRIVSLNEWSRGKGRRSNPAGH